ncbi:MAG: response regulator transcription factor [Taibaiella sp.]|nr:response regulator transcription factor [Taibaiella sp.]
MIKLIIADDHQMFIDGIKSLLMNEKGIKVVGQALNGKEVITLLDKEPADIVLLDVNMPEMDGIEATKLIRQRFPTVKILMLTMYNNHEFVFGLMNAGASGYILKNTGRTELLDAIKSVNEGKTFYSKEVTETILQNFSKKPAEQRAEAAHLTEREKDVLKLIAQEYNTQEIAAELFISTNTVETHRKNLLSKLQAKNIAGLVKFAIQTGLVS